MKDRLLVFLLFMLAAPATRAFAANAYDGVQFYRFTRESGVELAPDFQIRMIEELIHVFQQTDKIIDVYREGETLPRQKRVIRITGTVKEFAPGNLIKGALLGGFGVGNVKIKISATFTDAISGQVLSQHDFRVGGWTGAPSTDEGTRFLCEAIARYAKKHSYIAEDK